MNLVPKFLSHSEYSFAIYDCPHCSPANWSKIVFPRPTNSSSPDSSPKPSSDWDQTLIEHYAQTALSNGTKHVKVRPDSSTSVPEIPEPSNILYSPTTLSKGSKLSPSLSQRLSLIVPRTFPHCAKRFPSLSQALSLIVPRAFIHTPSAKMSSPKYFPS